MSARSETYELMARFSARGINLGFDEVNTLRRAEITLQRWSEQECGDSNERFSWAIERDEQTGIPYRCIYPHTGASRRYRIADKERGALRRVKAICDFHRLHFYHQTDPRGCSLYVSNDPLTDSAYTNGVPCCI